MGLYLEEIIFRLKIKLRNIWVTFGLYWCFTVFVAYPCYKFPPISKFEPQPSKNLRCVPANEHIHKKVTFTDMII